MLITKFFRILGGPRLYRIYQDGNREGKVYEAHAFETVGETVIRSISFMCTLGIYTSPIIIGVLFRKGYLCADGLCHLSRYLTAFGVLLVGAYILRGFGRCFNQDYMTFYNILSDAQKSLTRENKLLLRRYDFEFYAWPEEYKATLVPNAPQTDAESSSSSSSSVSRRRQPLERIKALPCQILSFLAIHTFGRRMIYPGSVTLMQVALNQLLMDGRAQLVREGGERFKVVTTDNNEIDCMVIDRRKKSDSPNGNTLVICCEGNAGFYEYGTLSTPMAAGYSVLGWNHPGFGGSTGLPYPDQEVNAINAVIQFAQNKLGFRIEDIVIFAWSIGGYTATWAAMTYPNIKGLILDATFDSLIPLALCRMPASCSSLVIRTIKDYMNLDNGYHISRYHGPVMLIRRTQDEMISTQESNSLQTNRGNELLIILLQKRFPKLVNAETMPILRDWLSGDRNHQMELWKDLGVNEDMCLTMLRSYVETNSASYPMLIGDDMSLQMKTHLVLYLARKHMVDLNSTHCTPLPVSLFQVPWSIQDVRGE